jgi:hypothetical protein
VLVQEARNSVQRQILHAVVGMTGILSPERAQEFPLIKDTGVIAKIEKL